MRVIPLYSWPADPLGSHRVTAPGGFELWQFEAQDPSQGFEVKAEFALGHPADSRYQRAIRQFLKNPTQIAPPSPIRFPSFSCSITENQREFCMVKTPIPPRETIIAEDGVDVLLDYARFARTSDGTILLSLTLRIVQLDAPEVSLQFHPEVDQQRLVDGTICGRRTIAFKGTGAIEHTFGTDIRG